MASRGVQTFSMAPPSLDSVRGVLAFDLALITFFFFSFYFIFSF
jgi:hypothetical protein